MPDNALSAGNGPPVRKLSTIQHLRAFAAIAVVLTHAIHETFEYTHKLKLSPPDLLINGAFGVRVFFVISGFIMFVISARRYEEKGYFVRFAVDRVLRIAPIYWIYTTLWVVAALLFAGQMKHNAIDIRHLLSSYLFVPYPRPSDGNLEPVLAAGWSLNYEMFFYAVFTFILAARPKGLILWLLAAFGALLLAHGLLAGVPTLYYLTSPIISLFAMGALLGFLATKGLHVPVPVVVFLAAVLGIFVLDAVIWVPKATSGLNYMLDMYVLPVALVAVGAYALLSGKDEKRFAILETLGDASYSVYLSHIFTINIFILLLTKSKLAASVSPYLVIVLGTLASLFIGYLSFRFVETPIAQWAKGLRRRMDGAAKA